jgi:hypothetical protein
MVPSDAVHGATAHGGVALDPLQRDVAHAVGLRVSPVS